MKYRLVILLIIFLPVTFLMAQPAKNTSGLAFANYLIQTERAYPEAMFILHQLEREKKTELKDTINYLLGWAWYLQKQPDSSNTYLARVSENSSTYVKSIFYTHFNTAYAGRFDEAEKMIREFVPPTGLYTELSHFQLASLSLLQKDLAVYQKQSGYFTYLHYELKEQEEKLDNIYREMTGFKPKSFFVAGALSALVPGLGKVYTGKTGEGVAAFLAVGSLAAITLENYLKDGLYDPKTILFGGLFTTFYVGNIWGSVVSVQVRRQEFYELKNDEVLLYMHIPLRNIFY